MLTRLFSKNFRAFEHVDIPLTKVNLFFGPNNSGKSSILSTINILSQTLDSADRDVALFLSGKFEDLGSYIDVVFRNNPERDITLGFELESSKLKEEIQPKVKMEVTFHYRKQRRETVVNNLKLESPPGEPILITRIAKTSNNQLIEQVGHQFSGVKLGSSSSGSIVLNHFIPYFVPNYKPRSVRKFQRFSELDYYLYAINRSIHENLANIEFVGPFRKGPERIYTFSGETPSSVGVHGEKAIDIIVADKSRRRGKKLNTIQKISTWFQKSKIASEIEVVPLTDRHFEIRLWHYDTNEEENLADVGYGCSQILPVLVAGYSVPSKSLLIIEQPEIHLHPRAEAEVGSFLHEVSKRDVQLFVETHSEHILLRLQSHIASGELAPDDINVFYVYSDKKNKICKRIPIGKDGFFTEEWPLGFFPERLEEAKRIAKYS